MVSRACQQVAETAASVAEDVLLLSNELQHTGTYTKLMLHELDAIRQNAEHGLVDGFEESYTKLQLHYINIQQVITAHERSRADELFKAIKTGFVIMKKHAGAPNPLL